MAALGQDDAFSPSPTTGSRDTTTGSAPALYAVIRDEIIGDILSGTYPLGSLLPSNAQICERWQVSHRTSRRVLSELAELGWARSAGTRGYIAAQGTTDAYNRYGPTEPDHSDATMPDPRSFTPSGPAPSGHTQPGYTGPTPPPPAYYTGQPTPGQMEPGGPAPGQPPPGHPGPGQATGYPPAAAPGAAPYSPPRPVHTIPLGGGIPAELTAVHHVQVSIEPTPPEVAHALQITGTPGPIHVRRRVITDTTGQIPLELRTSYTPAIDPASALARPDVITEPWPQALATHTGRAPATATSHIHARHPQPFEAGALHLAADAIVLVRDTTTRAATGTPIDYTVSVWPAESTRVQADDHATH
ncbi:UTRA domain-containing protein [Actinomadura sp. 6N118]|uniref:UTRA domain-containing protein n=1 Tax=Actinomadura sp. 6N118 TaxID=3375151 RepID=UPI0037A63BC2